MHILTKLYNAGVTNCPSWVPDNTHYLTLMGSHAYNVERPDSDLDYYGFCVPTKEELFPHMRGEIIGFGKLKNGGNRFTVYTEHHLVDKSLPEKDQQEYDFSIYNIVDYFQLCMEGNPNMIDSLFTPLSCVSHITAVGQLVKDNRKLFLSKKMYHTLKGYAYSQLHKAKSQERIGKRAEVVEKYGFDLKFAGHVVRLVDQCEQLLEFGDMDLTRSKEYHKSIRRGEVPYEEIVEFFKNKEKRLTELYENSDKVPHTPRESEIKDLLFKCLEHHYGSLKGVVERPNLFKDVLLDIESKLRSISKELHV